MRRMSCPCLVAGVITLAGLVLLGSATSVSAQARPVYQAQSVIHGFQSAIDAPPAPQRVVTGEDQVRLEELEERIIEMRDAGKAVLLVSVELDEIRSLADRVLVMFDGRVVGERAPDTTEGELGLLMAGVEETTEAAQ